MPIRPLRAARYLVALALVCAAALSGCSGVSYVARAAYEEGRLLWNRKPIGTIVARPDLDPAIRAKLETVGAVRDFAANQLGLQVGGAYQTLSQVDSGAIVYVVMAAPRDSLEPYQWWFPIVGYVPYRGYFDEKEAKAEAEGMEAQGYDTMVRPAVAFSSLGFFNDPLLSNLLKLDKVELSGVIIHELFHRTFFLASDVMFDESAANWVGSRGAMEFWKSTRGAASAEAEAARGVYQSDLKFSAFLLQAEARLLRIYGSGLGRDAIMKQREAAFDQIRREYAMLKPSLSGLERFDLDKEPLNNAVLINYLIYFHDLDNFAALGRMNHGDMRESIAQIIRLAKANRDDPFYAIWQATRGAPTGPTRLSMGSPLIAPAP